MDSDEAFVLLGSSDPSDRLAGARALTGVELAPSIVRVRQLRKSESDSWVRSALDKLIHSYEVGSGVSEIGETWISVAADDELQDVKAVATQSVTQTLLHEIRPLVGDIDTFAREDIGLKYPSSCTAQGILRLRKLLVTIQSLHSASAAPRFTEFDLANLISVEIVDGGFARDRIIATRTDSVTSVGDPELLKIAMQNAFRNAVEASETTSTIVVVNCGSSLAESWVVVLDDGIGLPEGSERVWEPGITKKSKDAHFGWGLPIAQQAVHSFGGSIKLQPREHGGTVCEIRWPHRNILGELGEA